MNQPRLVALAALALVTTAASSASAQRVADLGEPTIHRHLAGPGHARRALRVGLQTAGVLAIGTAWYWRKDDQGRWGGSNVVDWQLGFHGSSLVHKLGMSSEGWRFDGNSFGLNAVGHPMSGALTFWNARRNGLGPGTSFLVSTAASGAWEMITEWAEYGSVNDILATSPTGVPIGEAGYQLYRNWRRARYTVAASAGSQAGDPMTALGAAAALDTVPHTGSGNLFGGRRVGLEAELQFDGAVRGVEAGARTTLVGHYLNHGGTRLCVGAGAAFSYRDWKDRPARAWDLLATVGFGPTVAVRMQLGGVQVDAGADTHLAFGMAKSQAFAAWREGHPADVVRNSMQDRARPYYYARAFSARPRIAVRWRGVELGGALTALGLDSLEGADRDQERLTADPHATDTDVTRRTWLGYSVRGLRLEVDRRTHARRGTMDDARGESGERTTLLSLSFAH